MRQQASRPNPWVGLVGLIGYVALAGAVALTIWAAWALLLAGAK